MICGRFGGHLHGPPVAEPGSGCPGWRLAARRAVERSDSGKAARIGHDSKQTHLVCARPVCCALAVSGPPCHVGVDGCRSRVTVRCSGSEAEALSEAGRVGTGDSDGRVLDVVPNRSSSRTTESAVEGESETGHRLNAATNGVAPAGCPSRVGSPPRPLVPLFPFRRRWWGRADLPSAPPLKLASKVEQAMLISIAGQLVWGDLSDDGRCEWFGAGLEWQLELCACPLAVLPSCLKPEADSD